MAENWSHLECEAIVEDYLDMLSAELKRENYSKSAHRRILKQKLKSRSDGSIEYKHQNISAALIRAGYVYIAGYKPAWNYQELLAEVLFDRISRRETELLEIETKLIDQEPVLIEVERTSEIVVQPPERVDERKIRDQFERKPRLINYAEREAQNRRLGEIGEEFVLKFERRRLEEVGREDLIRDLEWTSKKRGDGTGYDIRSFRGNTDEQLFIEVKTTNAGKYQPFLISANEVDFSNKNSADFALYRLFDFAKTPRMFQLPGSVSANVELSPTAFSARF